MPPNPRKIRQELRVRRHHPVGAWHGRKGQEADVQADSGLRAGDARTEGVPAVHRERQG